MLGDSGRHELRADEFLPYLHHIGPQVVANDDGSVMGMAIIPGIAFELDEHAVRNARPHRLNSLLQMISDDNVTVTANLVRSEVPVELDDADEFQSRFAADTYRKYERKALGAGVMKNDWILSVTVHPRVYFEGTMKRLARQWFPSDLGVTEESERQLEDIMDIVQIWLGHYGVRRLGYRTDKRGWIYTEIGEALATIMTTKWRAVPMTNGTLGGSVYLDHVTFGGWRKRHTYAIEGIERAQLGMIFGYKEYPAHTQTGMFNDILSVEFPVVVTHSGRFLSRGDAQMKLGLKEIQMQNAGDRAASLIEGLLKLQDDVASNRTVMMSHHFSIAVYANNRFDLAGRASRVANIMGTCGATIARETRGSMAAYFTQLPGNRSKYFCRPGAVSSKNWSHFVSFENYPVGDEEGYWGKPVMRFMTNGGTIYRWHPHIGEVGHTAVFGKTGTGKTLFLGMLICALQRTLNRSDTMIVFDKDQGLQIAIMASGGSYVCLRRGSPSGSAPLRIYENTPRNVGHLAALFKRLIQLDARGPILPEEEDMLHRGVQRQLKLPRHLRSMLGISAFLGTSPTGAGARFMKWCRGGSYGWLFDNDEDFISVNSDSTMVGLDFTDLLPSNERPDDGCASAMAADVMFRMKGLMDGRRIVAVVDETRYYKDAIGGMLEDFALTGRKKELVLVMAAQKPDHIMRGHDGAPSGIGTSIMSQVSTNFCFPEETVRWGEYGAEGLGCTPAEFHFLRDNKTTASNKKTEKERRVLMRRYGQSAVLLFDITGHDDEIAILSGRPDTAALMEQIAAELGPDADPDDLVAEFKARWRLIKRVARRNQTVVEELV